jgi:stage II sporulation protein B
MEQGKAFQASGARGIRINVRAKHAPGLAGRPPGKVKKLANGLNKPKPEVKNSVQLKTVDQEKASREKLPPIRPKQPAPGPRISPSALLAGARNVIEWGSPANPFLKRKTGQRKAFSSRVTHLFLSILGAVLLGTAMGFSVLNLFFSNDPSTHSSRSIDDHLPPSTGTEVRLSEQDSATTAGSDQELPPLSVVMLQAGHFKEKEGARKMVQDFRTRGLAAVMSEYEPYRIFLGLSLTRDEALKLSSIYQNQQVDVYLKDMRLGGKVRAEGEAIRKLRAVLERGHRLFGKLSEASVREIRENGATPSPSSFDPGWMDQHRQFVIEYQGIAAGLPSAAREPMTEMIRALDQAVQSGNEARRHPSQALLWEMQEGLVRYVLAYERLHQVLGAR